MRARAARALPGARCPCARAARALRCARRPCARAARALRCARRPCARAARALPSSPKANARGPNAMARIEGAERDGEERGVRGARSEGVVFVPHAHQHQQPWPAQLAYLRNLGHSRREKEPRVSERPLASPSRQPCAALPLTSTCDLPEWVAPALFRRSPSRSGVKRTARPQVGWTRPGTSAHLPWSIRFSLPCCAASTAS